MMVYRGRGRRMERVDGCFCHVPAHTQQLTSKERNVLCGHTTTHTLACAWTQFSIQTSNTGNLAVTGHNK